MKTRPNDEGARQLASARGGLMVCGTTSDAGKTTIVAGLCRLLARSGVKVAPFKSQNMALNSAVTTSGHEIGRAQYLQAQAAGLEPEVAFNPILLKPTSQRSSQVIVLGESIGVMSAMEYHAAKPDLFDMVTQTLHDLRSRFDVVLVEGAGSPAEINLLEHDLVNLRLAEAAGLPAILVGDIDPGGVFASMYGTVKLLPDNLSCLIKAFVINKFRGDPALLLDGTAQLEERTGVPTIGVVPMLDRLRLDAEDSLALARLPDPSPTASLDVAVILLPMISNFTDLDPLLLEHDVALRFVHNASELGHPDLVILPGSKATGDDLEWLRNRGLFDALRALPSTATVLGVCGGYQMLGASITDQVESRRGLQAGLGMLPVTTQFFGDKVLTRRAGSALGAQVRGYQIHHGQVRPDPGAEVWLTLEDNDTEGVVRNNVYGTTLHGLFDGDDFRRAFLRMVARRAGRPFEPTDLRADALRMAELDRLADHLEEHLAIETLLELMATNV